MAAAAALVGSSPGGSRAIPITTLSFLDCARLGCGDIAMATIEAAVATRMDRFLNIRLLPAPILPTEPGKPGRSALLRHQRRQRHHRLGLVARGKMSLP